MSNKVEFGFFGNVLLIDGKLAAKMREVVVTDHKKLENWSKEDHELASGLTRDLARWLFPTPEVEELPKESAGDQHFKVDMILHFPEWVDNTPLEDKLAEEQCPPIVHPPRSIAFQIKSSEAQAASFERYYSTKGVTYKGQKYPCPGVWYIQGGKSLVALVELGNFVDAIVHPDISKAITTLENTRCIALKDRDVTYLEHRRFQKLFSPFVWSGLKDLNLVAVAGGRIIYRF